MTEPVHEPGRTVRTVRNVLYANALERGIRQSTLLSYERLLGRLDILDTDFSQVEQSDVLARLWAIDNPNSRRATIIALRTVFGWSLKIPRAIPRQYVLPDETTLRLALMQSPHEIRGLLCMYAGLRIGEACAITASDVQGDVLTVSKQVQVLHRTGQPTTVRIGPVKSVEGTVVIPHWLTPLVLGLHDNPKTDVVRESLRRAGRKVGIGLNPHMLRHWYATTMLDRGVPFALVSRQMRHSDIAVTLRTYSQFNTGTIHDAFG